MPCTESWESEGGNEGGGGAESDQGVCQSDARRARPTTSRYINYPGSVVVDLETLKTLLNKTFITVGEPLW